MFSVRVSGFETFSGASAARRLLGRGVRPKYLDQRIAAHPRWAEVHIQAFSQHPDSGSSTSEEFFIRVLAEVWTAAGKPGANPIEAAFKGALWDMDFGVDPWGMEYREHYEPPSDPDPSKVKDHRCPLLVAALEHDEGEEVSAIVLVPATWVEGLKNTVIDSCAWGAWKRQCLLESDAERASQLRYRNAEVRLVEAVPRGDARRITAVAVHDGAVYAYDDGRVDLVGRGVVKYGPDWAPVPVRSLGRLRNVRKLYSDKQSLWVGDYGAKRKGVIELRDDQIVNRDDKGRLTTPADAATERWGDRLPLIHGGLGVVSGAFDVDGAEWIVTSQGAIVELRQGFPAQLFMVTNAAESQGAAFTGTSFLLGGAGHDEGAGLHEVTLDAIRAASAAPAANVEMDGRERVTALT